MGDFLLNIDTFSEEKEVVLFRWKGHVTVKVLTEKKERKLTPEGLPELFQMNHTKIKLLKFHKKVKRRLMTVLRVG